MHAGDGAVVKAKEGANDPERIFDSTVIARSVSDEAIQSLLVAFWIASLRSQ